MGPFPSRGPSQVTVPPPMRLKAIDNGERMLARSQAPSLEDAWPIVLELRASCPEGFHPWRVEIQKSSKGRRAFVTVTFQRNRYGP